MSMIMNAPTLIFIALFLLTGLAAFLLEKDRLRGAARKAASFFMYLFYYVVSLALPVLCLIGMGFISEATRGSQKALFGILALCVSLVPLVITIVVQASEKRRFLGKGLPLVSLVIVPALMFGLLVLSE